MLRSIIVVEAALRVALLADIDAIAALWHRAWHDAHAELVPAQALEQRRLADFRKRVPERQPDTTVAVLAAGIVGFVTAREDNVEQLYVAEPARGTGVACALLTHAEQRIAARFDRAWLSVAAGNTRARHFYTRQGWRDVGGVDYPLPAADGSGVVAARRYEKWLALG